MQRFGPLVAFFSTLFLLEMITRTAFFYSVKDIPNERSLHVKPVLRVGGLAIMLGVALGCATQERHVIWLVLPPTLLLCAVSFIDDWRGLSASWRLLTHLVAACIFLILADFPAHGFLLGVLLLLAIIWMTNVFNFMDGADGLAGGMALIGFSTYGVVGLMHDDIALALLNFTVASASLAFLFYNFSPARIFMGDAGSIPLGFFASVMGTIGWSRGHWPFWFPILVFSPFIVDASVTLLKRMIRADKITQAHKEHYYQRLIRMGWGHRPTALSEYVLMACAGISAIAGLRWTQSMQLILLIAWTLAYLALTFIIDRAWQRYQAIEHATT